MNIFCSYAFTGEDAEAVTKRMRLIVDTLSANRPGAESEKAGVFI
jgi:hypothetical protein